MLKGNFIEKNVPITNLKVKNKTNLTLIHFSNANVNNVVNNKIKINLTEISSNINIKEPNNTKN